MVEIQRDRPRPGITFIEDCWAKNPVQSIVDPMTVIDSRAALREHNKVNDVVDCGNDKSVLRPKEEVPIRGIDETLERAWGELNAQR